MKKEDVEKLAEALKKVVAEMPQDERRELEGKAREAHHYLLAVRSRTHDPSQPPPSEILFYVHSLLNDDPDNLLAEALSEKPAADDEEAISITHVGANGGVFFGGRYYDQTDPYWAVCLLAWYDTEGHEPDFPENPAVIPIEDSATLAILGDWGGNNAAAQGVATAARHLNPDYFLHVGDVYYCGISGHHFFLGDYQRKHFLDVWPGAPGKSFEMNSNHDMYAHAKGLFNVTLASPIFAAQNGCSYFALHNSSSRIVGLDSAYFDPDRSGHGFMEGTLNPGQEQFLHEQAAAAAQQNQQLIVLTHHNGLSLDGTQPNQLWRQVTTQLSPLAGKTVIWYWGHEHAAAVYSDTVANGVTIKARCCGHSCIPWGKASNLENGTRAGKVAWYEDSVLGPGDDYFVTNGFALLSLGGNAPTEAIYGQNAAGEWSAHWNHPLPG